jgi:aspartyl-tRNA(Asn)/glutamyl-tRNA(Gln) amidotransferase subunit A
VALPSAALFNQCYFLVARSEAFARWGVVLGKRPEAFNALTRRSFAIGALIPEDAVADAVRLRARLRGELAAAMAEVDALVLPTTPDEAGELDVDEAFSRPDTAPYTRPFSLAGVPAVSVPCGVGARGRPLGVQIVGRHGSDAWLLAVATAVEGILPGIERAREWWA